MTSAVQGAQSFSRSIAVLQAIADAGRPISRAELSAKSDLTRPTLYRVIASLEAEGLIEPVGDGYRPGARLVSLARASLAQNDVRSVAAPILEGLRDATGETVHLAVRSGDAMVYIDKIESTEVVRMTSTIGTQVPFHSTSVGKAYLSAMIPAEATALIRRLERPAVTPSTVTSLDALEQAIAVARTLGYARETEENEPGITCFGAAIRDSAGAPVAAISVSTPLFRLNEAKDYGAAVAQAAEAVSALL